MTATIYSVDIEQITSEINDHAICCELNGAGAPAPCAARAEWILWRGAGCCKAPTAFACNNCKVRRMDVGVTLRCSNCGFVVEDSRWWYKLAQRIDRP